MVVTVRKVFSCAAFRFLVFHFYFIAIPHLRVNAQIMGYESPVEIEATSIYDASAMYGYLNALREASYIDQQLAREMKPILSDLYDRYNAGQYQECINRVENIFRNYTFYTRQRNIYSPLNYVRGLSYLQLDNEVSGMYYLVNSMNDGNKDAYNVLNRYFASYVSDARKELDAGRYYKCINVLGKAYATGLHSFTAYEIQGKAYEGLHDFDNAKKFYKLAKKQGSPYASQLLKDLKVSKRQYERGITK